MICKQSICNKKQFFVLARKTLKIKFLSVQVSVKAIVTNPWESTIPSKTLILAIFRAKQKNCVAVDSFLSKYGSKFSKQPFEQCFEETTSWMHRLWIVVFKKTFYAVNFVLMWDKRIVKKWIFFLELFDFRSTKIREFGMHTIFENTFDDVNPVRIHT